MIERIKDFFRPNLTKVLGQFEKTINQLEQIEAHQNERREKALATIAAAQAGAAQAQAAKERAGAFKANLTTLIGG